MKHPILTATIRTIFGKKNNALRAGGSLPVKLSGSTKSDQSLTVNTHEVNNILRLHGKSSVIDLMIEDKKLPVMVSSIQRHPTSHKLIHLELHKVNLKQKTHAEVALVFVGESAAVRSGEGVFMTLADTVNVEALPDNVPHNIEVDTALLAEVGAEFKVGNLPNIEGVTYLDDSEKLLARVVAHRVESTEPDITTETPEVEGEGEVAAEEVASEGEDTPEASDEEKSE